MSDINKLYEPVKDGISRVNEKIKEIFNISFFPEIPDNLLYGKRLRPLLLLYSSYSFENIDEKKINSAVSIELVHFASLIHDDVVDGADFRRNAFTLNRAYGNHKAVLLGDYVFSKAMEFISTCNSNELFNVLSRTSVEMCEGEIMDEFLEREERFDIKNYISLIEKKTASLFSASCEMGAILIDHPKKELLREFGRKFGTLFQILDDISDFVNGGEDIENSKITLPHIIFKKEIFKKFPDFLISENKELSYEVRDYLLSINSIESSYKFIESFFNELRNLILELEKPLKDFLNLFIDLLEKNKINVFEKDGSNPL